MTSERLSGTLRGNIAALAERESDAHRRAPWGDRVALRVTSFAGSMAFVWVHGGVYGCWIAINLGWAPGVPRFDPTFVALAMIASVEAIFLTTFVLIGQNRMAALDERRAELDLHVSLLTEHELTRLAELLDRVARRLEVPVNRGEFSEIEQDLKPVDVLDALDRSRADGGQQ